MSSRLALAIALLATLGGGCGSTNCSYQLLQRLTVEPVVGCCGAAGWGDVSVALDDGDVDLAVARYARPPQVHAWLTTTDCVRLFEGEYPPAVPAPLCPVYLGPVVPGEVSPRKRLPRGTYRMWVQAFASSPETVTVSVEVGVWGERCGGGGV